MANVDNYRRPVVCCAIPPVEMYWYMIGMNAKYVECIILLRVAQLGFGVSRAPLYYYN